MDYWVLDYNKQKAENHMVPEVNKTMKSLEHWFGPYPFYEDGFKMVDAPYIGMEHQSAIAYGNTYVKGTNKKGGDISNTGWGKKTDKIIVHEMAHEWFGNNITAIDLADRWIQEGFAGLGEELVIADLCGKQAGAEFLAGRYRTIENDKPIIARYGINEDGSQDNYIKGWAIIHMIRTIINDDTKFREILRGLNSNFYHKVVTTKQIEDYISLQSGINFRKLFDQYLRTAQVPILEYKIRNVEI
jgi:aminopeptidase N